MAPDMLHKKGNTNTGFIFLPYTFSKVHVKEKKVTQFECKLASWRPMLRFSFALVSLCNFHSIISFSASIISSKKWYS